MEDSPVLSDVESADTLHGTPEVFLACNELLKSGTIRPERLKKLIPIIPDMDMFLQAMTLTREQRVSAFETVLEHLSILRDFDAQPIGFFFGYLASLLNPGSFEYFGLVTSHLDRYPTMLLWYALCEG